MTPTPRQPNQAASDQFDENALEHVNQRLAAFAATSTRDMSPTNRFIWPVPSASASGPDDSHSSDVEMGENGANSEPVGVPRSSTSRRQLRAASRSILRTNIADFKIGFDPVTFSEKIDQWMPRLRHALPGSFDHLLLILLDDIDSYQEIQQVMATTIPEYLVTRHGQVVHADNHRDQGTFRMLKPSGAGGSYTPATLHTTSTKTTESRRIDEMFFHNELLVLRELVAPLRDTTKPIYWITNRSHQPHEMVDAFGWSLDLIQRFKKHFKASLLYRHESWTIYNPSPPGSEKRDKNMSLRQWRIDASRATTLWEKFPPDEHQLRDFAGQYRLRLINSDPNLARSKGFLPPLELPAPQANVTDKREITLKNKPLDESHGETLSLIVQIAEWLALARGFPAVHLFCDTVRLFTGYGVDIADATQVEFCRHLLSKQITPEDPAQHSLIPYILGKNKFVNETNVEYIQDQLDSNRILQQSLLEVDSLLSRGDESISVDCPFQTLKWVQEASGRRTLKLSEDFTLWNIDGFGSEEGSHEGEDENENKTENEIMDVDVGETRGRTIPSRLDGN